jgi:hypothetical protein
LVTSLTFYSNDDFELNEMSKLLMNHFLNPNWNEISFDKEFFVEFFKFEENYVSSRLRNEILKNLNENFVSLNDVSNLNLEEIKQYHSIVFSPSNCLFISSGGNYLHFNDENLKISNFNNSTNSLNPFEFKNQEMRIEFPSNHYSIGISIKLLKLNEMSIDEYFYHKIIFEYFLKPFTGVFSSFEYSLSQESSFDLSFNQTYLNLYFNDIENINAFEKDFEEFMNLLPEVLDVDIIGQLVNNLEISLRGLLENGFISQYLTPLWLNSIEIEPFFNLKLIVKNLKKNLTNKKFKETIQLLKNERFKIILEPNKKVYSGNKSHMNLPQKDLIFKNFYSFTNQRLKLNVEEVSKGIYFNKQETNGLVHFSIYSGLSQKIPMDYFYFIPVVIKIFEKIGARELDSVIFETKIEKISSNFHITPVIVPNISSSLLIHSPKRY